MNSENALTPIFMKYLGAYEKNPRSRVFAPLAESYRQMGMLDKALEIVKEGIKHHPDYVMGYLELAFCHHDMGKDALAHATLRPLVSKNRDNLRLQKLFGTVCIKLNIIDEALETFKYLLFVNPKDEEIAAEVKRLEQALGKKSTIVEKESVEQSIVDAESFDIDELLSAPPMDEKEADEWVHVEFTKPMIKAVEEKSSLAEIPEDHKEEKGDEETETPVVTHTLVDLYCQQGLHAKAINVLEKILELNPDDQRSVEKLQELRERTLAPENVEQGRMKLMNLIDSKVKKDKLTTIAPVEDKLWHFHSALRKRAEEILKGSE